MKKTFYAEYAYFFGLIFLALGTALMERADFGMSMVVAPAYILHLKISEWIPAFTFGRAEYCLQLFLLVLLAIAMRGFKKGYFFSFVTAVIYGIILDFQMGLLGRIPADIWSVRICLYAAGMIICSIGVASLFHTYLAPEAYELMVKEIALKYQLDIGEVKTVYDLISLAVSVLMSFVFFGFGHFEGVKLGTLITALVNGWMIGRISGWMDLHFTFPKLWKQ